MSTWLVASDEFYYHVTPSVNVPSIRSQGIQPQKAPTFRGAFGNDIRKSKGIFAFTSLYDALGFAFRFGWDGKTKYSIIKFRKPSEDQWAEDDHWEASMTVGKWVVSPKGIPPSDIVDVHGVNTKKFKAQNEPDPENPKVNFKYFAKPEGF